MKNLHRLKRGTVILAILNDIIDNKTKWLEHFEEESIKGFAKSLNEERSVLGPEVRSRNKAHKLKKGYATASSMSVNPNRLQKNTTRMSRNQRLCRNLNYIFKALEDQVRWETHRMSAGNIYKSYNIEDVFNVINKGVFDDVVKGLSGKEKEEAFDTIKVYYYENTV